MNPPLRDGTPGYSPGQKRPHTPLRHQTSSRRQVRRSASPASVRSLHPTETISPAKGATIPVTQDNVKVEELHEGDPGYATENDVTYPEALEEFESGLSHDAASSDEDGSASDDIFTSNFSRLECDDRARAAFEKKQREMSVRKRANSRVFKRSHSISFESETELSDVDAMADQSRTSSARRLRRRMRDSGGAEKVYAEASRGSPSRVGPLVQDGAVSTHRADAEKLAAPSAMDIDEST